MCLSSRPYVCSWDDSRRCNNTFTQSSPAIGTDSGAPKRKIVQMMGNKSTGGPFAPLVVIVRSGMGDKDFNKFRGKAISLHSQVIKDFCSILGADNKQIQGLIRLAKKNGEKLGFLA